MPNFLPAGAVVVVAAPVVGVGTAAVDPVVETVVEALLGAVLEPVEDAVVEPVVDAVLEPALDVDVVVGATVVALVLGVVVAAVEAVDALWPLPHAAAVSPYAIRSASVRVLVRRAIRRVSYRLVMWSPRTSACRHHDGLRWLAC